MAFAVVNDGSLSVPTGAGMQADQAPEQSERGLIVAYAPGGLVTIFQHSGDGASPKSFEVQFMPCDGREQLKVSEKLTIGSYEDLDIAVTIVAVKYGVCDKRWLPVTQIVLGSRFLR